MDAHRHGSLCLTCFLQDPGLEGMDEFFETVDDAARAERSLESRRAAAAASAASRAPIAPPPTRSSADPSATIEWEGEWS